MSGSAHQKSCSLGRSGYCIAASPQRSRFCRFRTACERVALVGTLRPVWPCSHSRSTPTGSRPVNVLPFLNWLFTRMAPPCPSTNHRRTSMHPVSSLKVGCREGFLRLSLGIQMQNIGTPRPNPRRLALHRGRISGTPQLAAGEMVGGPGATDDDLTALELASRRRAAVLVLLHRAGINQMSDIHQKSAASGLAADLLIQRIQQLMNLDRDRPGLALAFPLARGLGAQPQQIFASHHIGAEPYP